MKRIGKVLTVLVVGLALLVIWLERRGAAARQWATGTGAGPSASRMGSDQSTTFQATRTSAGMAAPGTTGQAGTVPAGRVTTSHDGGVAAGATVPKATTGSGTTAPGRVTRAKPAAAPPEGAAPEAAAPGAETATGGPAAPGDGTATEAAASGIGAAGTGTTPDIIPLGGPAEMGQTATTTAGPAAGGEEAPTAAPETMLADVTATDVQRGWIKGDGSHTCPSEFPIKGNASSMIYHLPGQPSYEATIPELCFATEDDARARGYRPRRH